MFCAVGDHKWLLNGACVYLWCWQFAWVLLLQGMVRTHERCSACVDWLLGDGFVIVLVSFRRETPCFQFVCSSGVSFREPWQCFLYLLSGCLQFCVQPVGFRYIWSMRCQWILWHQCVLGGKKSRTMLNWTWSTWCVVCCVRKEYLSV